MLFKKGIIAGALLMSILGLTACSSTGASDKIELRYATWDPMHKEAIETLITEYENQNPNIDIKLEQYSFGDYWTKMETAATGGSAPDILWMNATNFNLYSSSGMLADMTDMIKENNINMDDYLENLTSLYNKDGKQYAIPTFWDANVLLVNTELMKEYSIEKPKEDWTWDEMMAWLQDAKTKLPNDIYPITTFTTESNQLGVFNEVAAAGGIILSDDKTKAMINSPETEDGFKRYFELATSDLHTPIDLNRELKTSTIFKSNKALAIQAGSYHILGYSDPEQAKVAGNFEIYQMPKINEKAKGSTVIHGLGNAISSNSKHPKEAFDFIKFMSSKESMEKYIKLASVPQSRKDVQDVFSSSMKEQLGIDVTPLTDAAQGAMPLPNSFDTSKWDKVINDNFNEYLNGKMALDEALKKTQEGIQKVLDAEKK
ncbi:ABC transporter substrate-binding protein [Faecalimicrobium sp. JNUCC 81]